MNIYKFKRGISIIMAAALTVSSLQLSSFTAIAAEEDIEIVSSEPETDVSENIVDQEDIESGDPSDDTADLSEEVSEEATDEEISESEDEESAEDEILDTEDASSDVELDLDEELATTNINNFTLDANGGVFPNGKTSIEIENGNLYLTDDAYKPVREGYAFTGWYSDKECKKQISKPEDIYLIEPLKAPQKGQTIFAGWSSIKVTIVLDDDEDPTNGRGFHILDNNINGCEISYDNIIIPVSDGKSIGDCINTADLFGSIDHDEPGYVFEGLCNARPKRILGYDDDESVLFDEDVTECLDYEDFASITPIGDMTFYAAYRDCAITYTAHFSEDDTDAYFPYDFNVHKKDIGVEGKHRIKEIKIEPYETLYNYTAKFTAQWNLFPGNKKTIEGVYKDSHFEHRFTNFISWNKALYESLPADKNVDLYVKLKSDEDNVFITANPNGGIFKYYDKYSHTYKDTDQPVVVSHEKGTSDLASELGNFPYNKDLHYSYDGWFYDSKLKNPVDLDNDVINDDITVYAGYKKDRYVNTFKANGGTFDYVCPGYDVLGLKGTSVTEFEVPTFSDGSNQVEISNLTNTDITLEFKGWNYDGKFVAADDGIPTVKKDTVFTAVWGEKEKQPKESCIFTFDMGEGSYYQSKTIEIVHEFGSTPDHPFYKDAPVPTEIPEGCRFTGWYEDQALTKPITNEEIREYVTTDDVTFYAGYEEVCTITYKFANDDKKGFIFVDDNRNDPESDDYVIKAAKGKPLGDAFPIVKYDNSSDRLNTEQDYVFDGFYLSSDANPGSKIDLDSYIVTGDTVLYAGFTSEMFTITFKDHDEILRKICIPKGGSYRYYDREKDAETVYGCPELLNKRYDHDTRPATRPTGLWTTNADGSGEIWSLNEELHFYIDESGKKVTLGDNGFVPRSDMTLYAQYTETIKLSLDTDDHINKSASIKNRVLWFDEYNFDKEKTEHFAYVGKGTLYGYLGISDHRSKFKYDINNDKKFYRLGFKDKDCNEFYDISDAITKDNTVIYSKKSLLKAKVELCSGEGYFNEKTEMGSYLRYRTHELPDDYNESYGIIFDEPLIKDKTRAFLGFYYPLTSDPESPDMNRPYQYMMYKEGKCTLVFPESVLKAAYNNLWLVAAYGTSVNVTLDAGEGAYFERENESSQNANDKYIREKTRIQKVAAGKNMVLSSHLSEIRNPSGRRFLGWYYRDDEDNEQKLVTSETGGVEYFRAYEDITIYAKWSGEPGDEQLPDISSLSIYGPMNALKIGEKYETGIIVESSGTYDIKNVKWIVSDCTYDDSNNTKRQPVIVENNGNIIARAAGTAKIYAELDGVISNTITVTVSNEIIPAGVRFDPDITDYNLEIGDSVRVDLTFNPTWLDEAIAVTSTIPEVAEVRFLGNCLYIDAKKAGVTIINLKSDIIDVSIGVSVTRPAEKVKAPISDPEVLDGETLTVDAGTVLRLYSETLGARIYYTTDGSEPDEASAEFVGTLNLDASKFTGPEESLTIKAKAYKGTDYAPSDTVTFTYKLSSDWGDITDDLKASLFENKISNVPTDLWYVIDGNRVDEKRTDYKVTYTGSKITFDDKILVYHGKRRLWQNRDYTLKYSNNINAAANDAVNKKNKSVAPSVTIKGKGSYAKTRVFAFEILKADIDDSVISSERVMSLSKAAKLGSVKPVINYNGKKLVAGSDYVLKFYKGDAVSEDKLIADPAKYVPSKDTEYTEGVYTIAIEDVPDSADGKKGINFKAHDDNKPKADTIKVLTFDPKDKKIVQASKLKAAMIGSNKAVNLAYFDEVTESSEMSYYYDSDGKVDLEKVFDNGEGKKPLAYIYSVKNKALKYGTDYTLVASERDDHKSAGTHHFTITGAAGSTYIGSKTFTYSITGMSLKNAKVAGLITSAEYKGEPLTLADLFNENDKIVKSQGYTGVTLYTAKKSGKSTVYNALTGVTDESDPEYDNADYLISMNNTGATGKFTLTFTGINKYSGQIKKTIKVNRYNIGEPKKAADKKQIKIYPEPLVARYAKGGIKIDGLTVMHGEKTLREGIDYKVSYKNSTTVTVDPVALIKLKASKRPTLVIKGIGNYTGTNASRYINIVKDSVEKHVELSVSDVVYNKKGKKGYFMPVPKLVDGGKNISVGRNKDVEPISAKDYEYFYTEETTLTDGRRRGAGDPVTPIDKVPAGTMIAVTVTVKCGEKSPYEQTDGTELTGYYKVIDKTYNISKAKVVVNKPAGLMFSNGNLVIPPLKDDDNAEGTNFTVTMKIGKNNVTLGYDDFEVVSVKNNKFLGTATVTIRGKGQYGGIKKFTYKISARNISR